MDYFLDYTIKNDDSDEKKQKVLIKDKIAISFIFDLKTENDVLDIKCLYIGPSKQRITKKELPDANGMKMT